MVEVLGSDNLVYETTLALQVKGVSAFYVETAGRKNLYRCKDFEVVIYNPNRKIVTFCTRAGMYYTFNTAKSQFEIMREDSSYAILEAENIVKKSK